MISNSRLVGGYVFGMSYFFELFFRSGTSVGETLGNKMSSLFVMGILALGLDILRSMMRCTSLSDYLQTSLIAV